MSARWIAVLMMAATTFGCTKLKANRCDKDDDCTSHMCDMSIKTCIPLDSGAPDTSGSPGGNGGAGGAAGSQGTGGTPFTCSNTKCKSKGTMPICDMDAGVCRGCNGNIGCLGLDAGTNVCVTGDAGVAADAGADAGALTGMCVGCLRNTDCSGDRPICDKTTYLCRACRADAECTGGPGVCMFQGDGHCAADAETVYVRSNPVPSNCPSPLTSGAGTAANPFCDITDALTAAGTRTLLVLRGGSIPGGTTVQPAGTLSIVGQQSAIINPGASQVGIHVAGGSLYIRGVKILGADPAATIGIVADGNASVQLDGIDIENMPQGGLRVTGGASYDVINSIFAANGGTKDDGNRFVGGAWLLDTAPTAGQTARFAFNTVVSNNQGGVICAGPSQIIDASLLARNLGGAEDVLTCSLATTSRALGTTDPMLTATFRATVSSPCVDFVSTPPANAPDHDIDAVSRPQNIKFDCGASEYKKP